MHTPVMSHYSLSRVMSVSMISLLHLQYSNIAYNALGKYIFLKLQLNVKKATESCRLLDTSTANYICVRIYINDMYINLMLYKVISIINTNCTYYISLIVYFDTFSSFLFDIGPTWKQLRNLTN